MKYSIDTNGIIFQENPQPITYNQEYVNSYRNPEIEAKSIILSYNRFKFIKDNIRLLPYNKTLKVLDFGFGTGSFEIVNKSENAEFYVYDIVENPDVPENSTFVQDPFEDFYDIVCFFDSLEHTTNPYDVVRNLKTKYISISVPWCPTEDVSEPFMNWKHRKPNEHLFHFNHKSIIRFFDSLGYSCVTLSNFEDSVRKCEFNKPNILSGIFRKVD